MTEAQQPVRVYGLGLDQRFKSMLNVFFMRSSGGGYVLSDDVADMLVVDIDAVGARKMYNQHRENNQRIPTILFSINDSEYRTRGHVILLRKPFTVRQLQSAFDILTIRFLHRVPGAVTPSFGESDVVQQQRARLAQKDRPQEGSARAEDKVQDTSTEQSAPEEQAPLPVSKRKKAKPTKAARSLSSQDEYIQLNALNSGLDGEEGGATYRPDEYLQGVLVSARKQGLKQKMPVQIKLSGGLITIDPELKLARVRMGDYQLREACSFKISKNSVTVSEPPGDFSILDENEKGKLVDLGHLIWKASLYACRGRVPTGIDMGQPFQLRHWPNLTRMTLTPSAVRVAAAWVAQPASIEEMVKQFQLPSQYVTSFFSAAYAIELFESGRKSGILKRRAKPKSQSGGLFKRILNRLRSFS